MARYKRELRRAINKNKHDPEIDFLNITAMLDMMTIILVFLLKSMSQSSASLPQSGDLTMPKSVLTTEASQERAPTDPARPRGPRARRAVGGASVQSRHEPQEGHLATGWLEHRVVRVDAARGGIGSE